MSDEAVDLWREHYRWWTVKAWRTGNVGLKLGPVTVWAGPDGLGVSFLGRWGWEWSRTLGRRVWRLHA